MKMRYLILFIPTSSILPMKNKAHENMCMNDIKMINKKIILIVMMDNNDIVGNYCDGDQREQHDDRSYRYLE